MSELNLYPEMNKEIVALLRLNDSPMCLYAAQLIEEQADELTKLQRKVTLLQDDKKVWDMHGGEHGVQALYEDNQRLLREVANLAVESVNREKQLALIEAEVAALAELERAKAEGCEFCKAANFSKFKAEVDDTRAGICLAGGSGTYPKDEQFMYCPQCGRKLREENTDEL